MFNTDTRPTAPTTMHLQSTSPHDAPSGVRVPWEANHALVSYFIWMTALALSVVSS